jgi:UDP-N-acetylmuramate dehydrogenase
MEFYSGTIHERYVRITAMEFIMTEFPRLFLETMGRPVRRNVPLLEHSTFRIGGPADFFFDADSLGDLKAAVKTARLASLPYYVIGGGSNLLFDDDGFRGLIIKNRVKGVRIDVERAEIEAFSGSGLADMVISAVNNSLEGIEFMAGIPGTLGGAVCGNAGAFGKSAGDFLERALLLSPEGEEVEVLKNSLDFGYRRSKLKSSRDILVKATFRLSHGDREKIKADMQAILDKRKGKHPPWTTACAGSYFKNPIMSDGTKVAAGRLLDEINAKSLVAGRAAVYSGHANFIINLDNATSRDVLRLAEELKGRVKAKFGVDLEEEVIYLPAGASRL